ncbi:MAG: hypothetical protein WBQ86_03020, partial [Candidatus Binatus sp.]
GLISLKATDAAEQMRETVQITGLYQLDSTHHGRKSQDLSFGLAMPAEEKRQTLDNLLEESGSRINTVDRARQEQ